MDLAPFKNLIRDKSGLFFEDKRSVILAEGIRTRMLKKGIKSHIEYFNHLLRNQDEFANLINVLTINETYFFREPVHLKILSERLLPELLKKKKPGIKVKILSAGCATGEEPYSLVMTIMEKYGPGIQNLFSIMAVDVDSDAIRMAKEGIFGTHSFRSFDFNLREKYLKKVGGNQYEMKAFVKERVEFREFNLLSDFYPDTLRETDIIFYRNVSIYFKPETQKRIFRNLCQILNDKGYLFVSSTETLSHNVGILSLIELDGIFLFQKNIENLENQRDKNVLPPSPLPLSQWERDRVRVFFLSSQKGFSAGKLVKPDQMIIQKPYLERRKGSQALFDEALSLAKSKKYGEALSIIDKLLKEDPSFIKAYTLKGSILVNLKQFEEAERICLKTIEMDQWCLEGYLLLGLIAKFQNDEEKALRRFKEALYIQSSCWLAHFYLAEIYHSRGERERTCHEYDRVIKLLEKGSPYDHGLTYFPLSFPVDQVAHLCSHNISKLKSLTE